MKLSSAVLLGAAAAVSAQNSTSTVSFTTTVVTAFTTVCPSPTTLVFGGNSYIATAPSQTLIVTNCPCTISAPVTVSMVTSCASSCSALPTNGTKSATPTTFAPVGTSANTAVPAAGSPTSSAAADHAFVVGGAGVAGLLGFLAYIL